MSLAGRHVVVTGGGTGVGAETARALAAAGATVTILGRRQAPLAAQGLPYALCDVTDAQAVGEVFEASRRDRGPILAVVANAGGAETAPFDRTTPDLLGAMLAVNLMGVANVWQAAIGDMRAAEWGRMIAVASMAGLKGYAYASAYCAAKHGVVGLTRALAVELATSGITVNAVCPGFVETPLLDRSVANIVEKTGMTGDAARGALLAGNPQGRFVQTDEVAGAVLWLMSDAARSVNGHMLTLSGGET